MCLTSHLINCMDYLISVHHTIMCKVPQSSSEFQTQTEPQRPGRISNASQRRAPIGRRVKNKGNIEYPFEHVEEVIHYTLDCVSIHPVITKIQASFLTQLPERKENAQGFQHEANCNALGVVGAKSGAGSREYRVALLIAHKANISHPTKHRVHNKTNAPNTGTQTVRRKAQ